MVFVQQMFKKKSCQIQEANDCKSLQVLELRARPIKKRKSFVLTNE